MTSDQLEAVFIAANVAEAERVEALLDEEGIEYELVPEPFLRSPMTTTCFTGLLLSVLPGQAAYCRKLLAARGLSAGIVMAEDE